MLLVIKEHNIKNDSYEVLLNGYIKSKSFHDAFEISRRITSQHEYVIWDLAMGDTTYLVFSNFNIPHKKIAKLNNVRVRKIEVNNYNHLNGCIVSKISIYLDGEI